jgi:FkbM family methyltransferase
MGQLPRYEKDHEPIFAHSSLAALQPHDNFTIIDVGANEGDVSLTLLKLFPKAQIYAIEADPKTCQRLAKRFEGTPAIHPVNVAIHTQSGTINFHSSETSTLSSIIDLPDHRVATTLIQIQAKTLDELVHDYQINSAAVLKVDTEGNDLEVLKSADKLLKSAQLYYVICEFGIHPADKRHVQINLLLRFMAQHGFYLSTTGGFGCFADYIYGNALFVREGIHKGE